MKKTNRIIITTISLITLLFGVAILKTTLVSAQANNNTGQALEIAPPVLILSANPGQTIKAQINVRDISNGPLNVTSQINDFMAAGEEGIPKILLDDTQTSPYSMKDWVSFTPEMTLKSKEIKVLPFTINVPSNASPGGYYSVFRFTATPPDLKDTGVSLSASLGALVLLKVNGEAKEQVSIEEFSTSKDDRKGWLFEFTPIDFIVRLKNSGNIHETPRGQITITDMFNNKVANVNVNAAANNILPQSIRKFTSPLDSSVIGNKMLFGRYTANLKVVYGTNNQELTKTISFWIIPYKLIAVIIIVLIALITLVYFVIKRYNRYVIRKAQGVSKPKRKRRNKK